MGNTRTKIIAGAVLLAIGLTAAGSAMSTDVYGGGATLPAGGYVGFDFARGTGNAVLSSNTGNNNNAPGALAASAVASNSMFGAWVASTGTPAIHKISYCQTGSGNGKKIFDNTDGASPATALDPTNFCTGGLVGFGENTSATVKPHFAGSDAPMSQSEFTWFSSPGGKGTTFGQPSEFPAVIGSVAIVFNNSHASSVNLSIDQVCRVFSGAAATWGDINLVGPNGLATDPIKVVYRGDGSGTTFSLSNFLSNNCAGTAAAHFVTDQAFTMVDSKFGLPSGSIAATGNPGVINQVSTTAGSIGYAEAANLADAVAHGLTLDHAKVAGMDPVTNLPNAIALVTSFDRAITGADATTGIATTAGLTSTHIAQCVNLVEPSTYAKPPVDSSGNPTRYPILAVSYLIANSNGNGSDGDAVRSLFSFLYTHANVTTIGTGTGYAFVTATPALKNRVAPCINN